MKIKLFSHGDLDGLGCIILGQLAFRNNLDYEICNYDDVDSKISEFLLSKDINTYDKVFITDISVNDEVAKAIDIANKQYTEFALLDHHPTALGLNKYEWAKVIIEDETEKVSGTSLFYEYLYNNNDLKGEYYIDIDDSDLFKFVEKVKRYDTWLWTTKYNDIEAKQLNDLLYIYGKERFINKFTEFLVTGDWYCHETFFDETDKLLLELEQDKINNYIEKKNKEIIKNVLILDRSYNVGIVFAEQYISQLGNELAKINEDLDFIIIISNCNTISYRGIKTDIDLGKLTREYYSGGGHPMSAGSQIGNKIKDKILDLILNIEK